jgi:hypothetical protein
MLADPRHARRAPMLNSLTNRESIPARKFAFMVAAASLIEGVVDRDV